jgi:hypothetical protein
MFESYMKLKTFQFHECFLPIFSIIKSKSQNPHVQDNGAIFADVTIDFLFGYFRWLFGSAIALMQSLSILS